MRRRWAGRPCSTRNGLHQPLYSRSGYKKDTKTAPNNSQTRTAEVAEQKQYNEAHREAKRSIRADRRGHIENLARQAEEAAAQRNVKGLYDITKKVGRYQQTDKLVKKKQGKLLTTI